MSKRTSVEAESNAPSVEERLAVVEERLAAVEQRLALVWSSRLGGQLRMLEGEAKQRAIDAAREQERADAYAAAATERAATFKQFVRAHIARHPDLEVTAANLMRAYNEWCLDKSVPRLCRLESVTDLQVAMQAVFPNVEEADVHPPGYLGRPDYVVPGYVGIDFVEESDDPAEVVASLESDRAREEAERRDRREMHELDARVEDAIVETRRTRDEAARLAVEAAQK